MELALDIKKKLQGFKLEVKFETGSNIVGLLGASGSGKSMTLRCIAGLEKPDEGRIVLNGRVLYDSYKGINLPSRERKTGFLFQNYALFPHMTVGENIGFGLKKLSSSERSEKINKMISMIHLEGLEKRYPYQLSGGQQQRVALARALAVEPEALLLDEPFSALDMHLKNHMLKQLMEALEDYHGITLFVTHNMEEAYGLCNNLVVLSGGTVKDKGPKGDIFTRPKALETAKLTGCKNFSRIRHLSQYEFEAVDWGIRLKTIEKINLDTCHAGMRALHIRLADEGEKDNVFNCWPSFTAEMPYRMMIYLVLERFPSGHGDYHIQWNVSKEEWEKVKVMPLPWKICLSPEKLMLVK